MEVFLFFFSLKKVIYTVQNNLNDTYLERKKTNITHNFRGTNLYVRCMIFHRNPYVLF